jgi:hypothetical protein
MNKVNNLKTTSGKSWESIRKKLLENINKDDCLTSTAKKSYAQANRVNHLYVRDRE